MIEDLLAKLRDVLDAQADVEVAVLFGSAAVGRLAQHSDVDVYLRLRPGVRWSPQHVEAVTLALDHATRREVDLVVEDRDATSTLLRMEVARHGRLVLERHSGAWTALRADAMVDYADLEPFVSRCGAGIRRRVRARANG